MSAGTASANLVRVYVWEWPVRVTHWLIVGSILVCSVTGLYIGSPFLIYSIVINFAVGLANKLTPQIPIFFIATPFVMAGGMFLLYFTVGDFMTHFNTAFSTWLVKG